MARKTPESHPQSKNQRKAEDKFDWQELAREQKRRGNTTGRFGKRTNLGRIYDRITSRRQRSR